METVRVTGELVTSSMPVILMITGIATGLLAITGCLYRFRDITYIVRYKILRQPQYNYRRIFREYLEKFKEIDSHQNLYDEILSAACRIVSAKGASLMICDSNDNFRICAARGLSTFSLDSSEAKNFLTWLEKQKNVVTKENLLRSKLPKKIKAEGLAYCVKSNTEACVPLIMHNSLYGILNVGAREKDTYDEETCDLLNSLSTLFISTIRNIELQQKRMRDKLELDQALQLRNQILTNLSHELRTPLNSIIGLSEVMKTGNDGDLTKEQGLHISMIHEAGMRLLKTINTLVDLSKLEANHLELNVQKLNLRRLLGEVAESISFSKYTKFLLEIKDGLNSIYGDETRLRQVFQSLLDNAAKFTKHGKIEVNASKCGEMVKVEITDTGVGIPSDLQEKIMNGFYQQDNGITREHEGLGLGLAMSQKIVKLHGGRLWFASKVGQGSNFYLTLPLKPTGIDHPEIRLS